MPGDIVGVGKNGCLGRNMIDCNDRVGLTTRGRKVGIDDDGLLGQMRNR